MLRVIFFITWILNIVSVFLKKKSKILSRWSFVVMILIFAANTYNNDIGIYKREYMLFNDNFEIGYELFTQVFFKLGFSYNQCLFVIALISYFIIFYVFSKYSDYYEVFYSIYFACLVFFDITQVRNFICMALLVLALEKLAENKRWMSALCIFIGAQFQTLGYIYMPLCLFDIQKKRTKKFYRICVIIIFICCIFIFLNGNRIPFVSDIFAALFGTDKLYYFLSQTRLGFLVTFFLQFMNVFLALYSKKIAGKFNDIDIKKKKYIEFNFTVNLYGFMVFPLLMINYNFYRTFRNFIILNIIAIAIVLDAYRRKSKNTISKSYVLYLVIICVYAVIWAVGLNDNMGLMDTILDNNYFFN